MIKLHIHKLIKFNYKKLTIIILYDAIYTSVLIFAFDNKNKQPIQKWILIEEKPLTIKLGLVGQIEPASLMTITAPFDGVIKEKYIEDGQRVERGQSLLLLDTSLLEIQLRDALTSLFKAKNSVYELQNWTQSQEVARARRGVTNIKMSLSDTERKLAEAKDLFTSGIVPRMEIDTLEQQARVEKLDLIAAESELKVTLNRGGGDNLKIAEMELINAHEKYDALQDLKEKNNLIATFSGTIIRPQGINSDKTALLIQQGAKINQGQPIFGLASLEKIKILAKVEETDINQLQHGQSVEITGDAFEGITLHGNINAVGSLTSAIDASSGSTTYDVIVAIPSLTPEQQKYIRLGMSARLSIVTYINDHAMVIPANIIQEIDNKRWVEYKETDASVGQMIEVKTGRSLIDGVEVFGVKSGYFKIAEE